MKKKFRILLWTVLVLIAVGTLAALNFYGTFYYNNVRTTEKPQDIRIYRDFSYDQMISAVLATGAIDNESTFLRAARFMKLPDNFRPGLYRLKPGAGNKALVRMLSKGWQQPVRLVIPGYFRSLDRFADFLGEQLEAGRDAFARALNDPSSAAKYGFDPQNFIGMFIPNTYEVWWTVTPEDFMDRMNKEYEKFWSGDRDAKAAAIGLTRQQVSTLAAIVIEETKYEPEMPRVAGVYMNRLHSDMLLQADPTVIFAVGDPDLKRVLNRHLETDSPYNTYRNEGLPPGPIKIASIKGIDAVLNHVDHDYLYMCAKEDFSGTHNFATTYQEHLQNAAKYSKALNERGIK